MPYKVPISIIYKIAAERERQIEKWGDLIYLYTIEEKEEVSKAILGIPFGSDMTKEERNKNIENKLIKIIAVAVAWIEDIHKT